MSDVSEQSARLNTLMRFHQYKEALPYAYKYRLDLQLSLPQGERTLKALRQVDEAIEQLEKLKTPRWKVVLRSGWTAAIDFVQNLGQPRDPSQAAPAPPAEPRLLDEPEPESEDVQR